MAGLLGQIFSAGNVAKRQLRDLLGNPVLGAQQMAGNLNDRARNLNEMTSAAAREGMDYGPATQRLAGLMADAYNPMGLTVFHGSPAKFSKFDRTKIGSGEGAQAYGYGHYVAESPGVAKDYQRRLAKETQATDLNTKMKLVDVGGKPLTSFNVDMNSDLIDAAKAGKTEFVNLAENKKARWEELSQDQSYPFQDYAKQKVGAYNSLLDAAKKSDVDYTGTGVFYEIDLPDEQIARMLDWDKPLSEQPEEIRKPVVDFIQKNLSNELKSAQTLAKKYGDTFNAEDLSGRNLYQWLTENQQNSPEAAADMLRQAGVPGIRYLDQGSRGVGEGTSNFVVFPGNEDLLTILKRNGGLLD